jgi:anti-anti-sigma factor
MQAFAATWGSGGVLYLEGEFDLEAEEAAVGALRGHHPYDENGVVIDVSRLTFMDSTGIRVLQTLATGPGATRVVLRSPRRGVQKVLELVGIAKRPPIAVGEDAPASHEDSFIF